MLVKLGKIYNTLTTVIQCTDKKNVRQIVVFNTKFVGLFCVTSTHDISLS